MTAVRAKEGMLIEAFLYADVLEEGYPKFKDKR